MRFVLAFFFLFGLCAACPLQAQNKILDSLLQALNTRKSVDSVFLQLQNEIAYQNLLLGKYDEALNFSLQAVKTGEAIQDKTGLAQANFLTGYAHFSHDRLFKALNFAEKALAWATQANSHKHIGTYANLIGNCYFRLGKYESAVENYFISLSGNEKINDLNAQASNHNNIGLVQKEMKNYAAAVNSLEKAIELSLKTKNSRVLTNAYNNLGICHERLQNYEKALFYYQEALLINTENKRVVNMMGNYINLGNVFFKQGKYGEAAAAQYAALALADEAKSKNYEATAAFSLSSVLTRLGKYDSAALMLQKGFQIAKEISSLDLQMTGFEVKAQFFEAQNKFDSAIFYFRKFNGTKDSIFTKESSEALAKMQTRYETEQKEAENLLLKKDNDLKEAQLAAQSMRERQIRMEAFEKEQMNRLLITENLLKTNLIEKQNAEREKIELENQKRAQENELLKKEKAVIEANEKAKNEELRFQKLLNAFFAVFIFFMIVLIALIARFFVIQRKKNLLLKKQNREISEQKNLIEDNNKQLLRLNEEILQQKEEITVIAENLQSANEEISSKNELIEYKNAKITSSINYAKRIQAALLPSENSLKQILGDFLLFYRPKDIVSGDFYWVKKIESGDKTLTVVVVADCTGHGVPGALISMIGIELLEEIVIHGKIFLPNEILFTLNQKLRNLLRPEETGTQDGMDLIVLTFVKQGEMTEEILFSGAMNPILFKRKNAGIEIIKGDKMPIGGKLNARKNPEFTLHKISYTEGMTFFCMTDGLQDQFGGELKKKLGLQRIIRFFEENADLTFEEQERQLQSFFEKWQGEEEQIDDITLLSFAV